MPEVNETALRFLQVIVEHTVHEVSHREVHEEEMEQLQYFVQLQQSSSLEDLSVLIRTRVVLEEFHETLASLPSMPRRLSQMFCCGCQCLLLPSGVHLHCPQMEPRASTKTSRNDDGCKNLCHCHRHRRSNRRRLKIEVLHRCLPLDHRQSPKLLDLLLRQQNTWGVFAKHQSRHARKHFPLFAAKTTGHSEHDHELGGQCSNLCIAGSCWHGALLGLLAGFRALDQSY